MYQADKEMGWGMITLTYLVYLALTAVLIFLALQVGLFDPLNRVTGGLINQTLQIALISMAVMSLLVFGLGRQRPGGVGLIWARLPQALVVLVAFWLVVQAALLVIGLLIAGSVQWSLGSRPATVLIGALLAQFLGNTLLEESFFRGFLFPHCFLKFTALARKPWQRLLAALLASQFLFALAHTPNLLFSGSDGATLGTRFITFWLLGIEYALIYLVTKNLFISVAIHGLADAHVNVVAASVDTSVVYVLLGVALLLLWLLLRVRRDGFQSLVRQDARPMIQVEGEPRVSTPPE